MARHAKTDLILLVTSQLPVDLRHEAIGEPTLADAIRDRLTHSAYRITGGGNNSTALTSYLYGASDPAITER